MSALCVELERYLELRRQMGFKLRRGEKLLRQFVDYCDAERIAVVTADVALKWATLPKEPSQSWLSMRLGVVRGFARHLRAPRPERHRGGADLRGSALPARNRRADALSRTPRSEVREPSWRRPHASVLPPCHAGLPRRSSVFCAATGMRARRGDPRSTGRTSISHRGSLVTVREGQVRQEPSGPPLHKSTTLEALGAYLRAEAPRPMLP